LSVGCSAAAEGDGQEVDREEELDAGGPVEDALTWLLAPVRMGRPTKVYHSSGKTAIEGIIPLRVALVSMGDSGTETANAVCKRLPSRRLKLSVGCSAAAEGDDQEVDQEEELDAGGPVEDAATLLLAPVRMGRPMKVYHSSRKTAIEGIIPLRVALVSMGDSGQDKTAIAVCMQCRMCCLCDQGPDFCYGAR